MAFKQADSLRATLRGRTSISAPGWTAAAFINDSSQPSELARVFLRNHAIPDFLLKCSTFTKSVTSPSLAEIRDFLPILSAFADASRYLHQLKHFSARFRILRAQSHVHDLKGNEQSRKTIQARLCCNTKAQFNPHVQLLPQLQGSLRNKPTDPRSGTGFVGKPVFGPFLHNALPFDKNHILRNKLHEFVFVIP